MASSTELSTTSQTRWCKPMSPVEPMYIAGRKRTASMPPRTLIDFASYLWPPCGAPPTFSLSPMFSPGTATSREWLRRWTDSGQFGVRIRAQKNSFSVKQGRRACGIFRTSPHPVIPVSPGESETRRVPAPSHLAQRDVAKTHVSPGLCAPSSWREAQFRDHICLADVTINGKLTNESTTQKLDSIRCFFSSNYNPKERA